MRKILNKIRYWRELNLIRFKLWFHINLSSADRLKLIKKILFSQLNTDPRFLFELISSCQLLVASLPQNFFFQNSTLSEKVYKEKHRVLMKEIQRLFPRFGNGKNK